MIDVNYLIVDTLSPYNIILERPTINALGEVISSLYVVLKYPLPRGRVGKIKGDQLIAQECFQNSMAIKREKLTLVGAPLSEVLNIYLKCWDPKLDAEVKRLMPT